MKRLFFFLCVMLLAFTQDLFAQFRNDQWFWCIYPWATNSSGPWSIQSLNPLVYSLDTPRVVYSVFLGSISELDGSKNINFDGTHITNRLGTPIEGDTIPNTPYFDDGGPNIHIALAFLTDDQYCFIEYNKIVDTIWTINPRKPAINVRAYYVDPDFNNGQGKITHIDTLINETYLLNPNSFSTVRHANGRDWWLFAEDYWGNNWYRSLITKYGASPFQPFVVEGDTGFAVFSCLASPDGNFLAKLTIQQQPPGGPIEPLFYDITLRIFQLDRCEGILNPIGHLKVHDNDTAYFYTNGRARSSYHFLNWSPNSKYIYLNSYTHVSYIDFSNHTVDSLIPISSINSITDSIGPSYLFNPFLAADGNIYYSNQSLYISRLLNPDQIGGPPIFESNAITLPSPPPGGLAPTSAYVNLKLGPIDGSICDSLGIDAVGFNEVKQKNEKVELYPNPTQDIVTIKGIGIAKEFKIYSMQGNLVDAGLVSNNTITLASLQAGAYIFEVQAGQKVYYGKVLKRE